MKKNDVYAVIFLILITGVFFYKSLLFGKVPAPTDALVGLYHPYRDSRALEYPNGIPYKNYLITDPVRQQIPWRKSVIESLRNKQWPVWDATSFSGTPLFANIQSGALYPLNILFFFLPFYVAWTMIIISQVLCAGLFFYLFLRVHRLDITPSLFGALIFAFNGQSIAWLTWGTILSSWMWTPLALASVHELFARDKPHRSLWVVTVILSLVFSFFAGHLQIFFYSAVFVAAYALYLADRYKNTQHTWKFFGIMISVVIAVSVQLVAILRWLPQTNRLVGGSAWMKEGFFIPFRHLAQFVAPDFFGNPATLNYWGTWNYGEMVGYIGIAGIIFAMYGISRKTKFWSIAAAVALVFAIQSPVSSLPYILHIPFISSLQPTRLLLLIDLCLSTFAAFGFAALLHHEKRTHPYISAYIAGAVLAFLWVLFAVHSTFGISTEHAMIIRRNLYWPTVLFAVTTGFWILSMRLKKPGLQFIFIIILIMDLLRFGWKFTPFTDPALFFPVTKTLSYLMDIPKPFRIMTTDDRILPPDTNTYYGIESVNGYDPVHSLRYDQFIAAMERGEPNIRPPFGYERIIVPKNYRSRIFNLLNIRFILSFDEIRDSRFRLISEEGETKLYENTTVIPRAYFAVKTVYKKEEQEIIGELYDNNFQYTTDAVVERPVNVLDVGLSSDEYVQISDYRSGSVGLTVAAVQPRFLVLGNPYYPGWNAEIDGKQTEIIRTNFLFMGVLVPPGTHSVRFFYR